MNKIIQQFYQEGIKNLQERVIYLIQSGGGLSEAESEIKKVTDALGRSICEEIIEALDEAINKDTRRKKDWYVERRNEEKTVITKLGEIKYNRTYYRSKHGKGYRHLVDEILGLDVHARMDDEMHAELAENASNMSYRKAWKSS